jgi:hypothetical protein
MAVGSLDSPASSRAMQQATAWAAAHAIGPSADSPVPVKGGRHSWDAPPSAAATCGAPKQRGNNTDQSASEVGGNVTDHLTTKHVERPSSSERTHGSQECAAAMHCRRAPRESPPRSLAPLPRPPQRPAAGCAATPALPRHPESRPRGRLAALSGPRSPLTRAEEMTGHTAGPTNGRRRRCLLPLRW